MGSKTSYCDMGKAGIWAGGEESLEPHNGNPYTALHTSKSLSEVELLRLVVAKQAVEIVRLKRGIGWKELV